VVAARNVAWNPQVAAKVAECRLVVRVLRGLVASALHAVNEVSPVRTPAATV
jgi:hypothetical protein